MSKPSKKKTLKQKNRQKKIRSAAVAKSRRAALESGLPDIQIRDSGVPDLFADGCKVAIEAFRTRYRSMLPVRVLSILKRTRETSLHIAIKNEFGLSSGAEIDRLASEISMLVGEKVFSLIAEEIRDSELPHSDFRVHLAGNHLNVVMRSLLKGKAPKGSFYYSPKKPVIDLCGRRFVIAYSSHAVEQICDRTVVDCKTYLGVGDAFAFMHDCVYFEPWSHRKQQGFVLYDRCDEMFYGDACKQVLGEEAKDQGALYYKLGYCIVVEHHGFAIAKTLLLPGMEGTPEYDWYLAKHGGDSDTRKSLYNRVTELSARAISKTNDFRLLKEFHDGGHEQIKKIEDTVFNYAL